MKYAIAIKDTKEFYPDPVFDDLDRITKKIEYLNSYPEQHQMDNVDYVIEELTPERESQHKQEWQRYVSLID